ncbi:hypothetical protein ACSHT2_06060 [Bradyrhizobium sp. PUT101]|uniref:hypothetical protein n=1 Tax=Bradyrhizobium sp. PUT101 TaxID=3447427 RepID=UPI003F841EB7
MPTVLLPTDPYIVALKEKAMVDLRECWCVDTDRQPYVAVAHLEAADMVAKMQGLHIENLPDEDSPENGFVFEKVRPHGQPECWVSVNKDVDYRRLFHKFLNKYYDLPRHAFLDRSIHVDHIFSRKRAERTHGMRYVRLALARGDVNSTFGRNWELNVERNHVAPALSADGFGSVEETDGNAIAQPIWPPEPISPGSYGLMRQINWPMATKAFDIAAPSGIVSIPYMIDALRELVRVNLLGPKDVEDEFGKFAAVFRMGSAGLPHYEGQRRVQASAITTDGIELTEYHTVAAWLAASLRA